MSHGAPPNKAYQTESDRNIQDSVSLCPAATSLSPPVPLIISSHDLSASSSKKNSKERKFFENVWTFRHTKKGKTETLAPDNYEYPFHVVLEGSLPESVEGLRDSFVIYRFKAEIGRKYAKDIVVRKPLRIIRTLDSNALELAHAMVSN